MKIIKIKSLQLTNTEFFEFLKQVEAIINKHDATKLKIKTAMDALIAFFMSLQAGLDKEKSNQLTKVLNELDFQRDILINDFIEWLEVMQRFPDAAIAVAARNLYHYLQGFGSNIANETQLSETTILTNIVDGFTKDASRKAAIKAMNGDAWITAIGDVNTEFANQYGNRVSDDASNKKAPSFSSLRTKVTPAYTAVIELLTNRYGSEKADGKDVSLFESCIGELNQLITQVNVVSDISKPKPPKDTVTEPSKE
jgi:hypothetical protein